MAAPGLLSSALNRMLGDTMAYGAWPPLTVRDWKTVLAQRDPDWGYEEEDFDGVLAARESRRIHELRGLIVGQVAEIENLLLYISSQVSERSSSEKYRNKRPGGGSAGTILTYVEHLLEYFSLENSFQSHVRMIREAIIKRNAIVHAVVDVAFSSAALKGPRESVLLGIRDNDEERWRKRLEDAEELDLWETNETVPWDVSEVDLERQLTEAHEALEKCIDIWIGLNEILPSIP
jgi:hypothetical protein